MKNSLMMIWVTVAGLAAAVCLCGVAKAEDFRATISGSFTNNTLSVTNTTGSKLALSAVVITKTGTDWNTATNATVTLNNGNGTFLLLMNAATNTAIYSDGQCGLPWLNSGVLAFSVGCAATLGPTTNYYYIITK